jgi:hypothetical protein
MVPTGWQLRFYSWLLPANTTSQGEMMKVTRDKDGDIQLEADTVEDMETLKSIASDLGTGKKFEVCIVSRHETKPGVGLVVIGVLE